MPPTDLAALLVHAAHNNPESFEAFYDLTIDDAYLLARLSVTADGVGQLLEDTYLHAWLDSASFLGSGLSGRTWLLVLLRLNAQMPGAV